MRGTGRMRRMRFTFIIIVIFFIIAFLQVMVLSAEEKVITKDGQKNVQEKEKETERLQDYIYKPYSEHKKALDSLNEQIKSSPKDVNLLLMRANEYMHLGMYSALKKDLENFAKGEGENFQKGDLCLIKGWHEMCLGDYKAALKDFEYAKELGCALNRLNTAFAISKNLLEQMQGSLPPKDWNPDYSQYQTITDIYNPISLMLLDMSDGFLLGMFQGIEVPGPEKSEEGIQIDMGATLNSFVSQGSKFTFRGTADKSVPYAPDFYVWNGEVINDKKFGVLLTNGTSFKYIKIEGNYKITKIGAIRDWKPVVESENKEELK